MRQQEGAWQAQQGAGDRATPDKNQRDYAEDAIETFNQHVLDPSSLCKALWAFGQKEDRERKKKLQSVEITEGKLHHGTEWEAFTVKWFVVLSLLLFVANKHRVQSSSILLTDEDDSVVSMN